MALVCITVTDWITQEILVPVDQWVNELQQQCQQLPWWDPRKWLCWFVTVLVKVVVWVTQNILVPILTVVCTFVAFVIGWIILVVASAIDAVCTNCNAVAWTNHWFLTRGKIVYVSSAPSATQPGFYDYTFTCNCPNGSSSNVVVTALNDDAAASEAKLACAKAC
jgi:hypothetical protein